MDDESVHCSSECHHLKALEALLDEKERSLCELQSQLNDVQEKCEQYKKDCEQLTLELQAQKLDLRDRLRVSRDAKIQTNNEIEPSCKSCAINSIDANTQTFESDFSYVESANSALDWQPSIGSQLTIADIVKDAACNADHSDYVFDETSGTYYNTLTGYYYDPYKKLFYEPHTKIYYSYDEETKTYSFHSQLDDDDKEDESITDQTKKRKKSLRHHHKEESSSRHFNKDERHHYKEESSRSSKHRHRSSKKYRKEKRRSRHHQDSKKEKSQKLRRRKSSDSGDRSPLESGELSDHSVILIETSDNENDCVVIENDPEQYPPSMRLIVRSSEKLNTGSLLLVTYKGGIVGKTEQFEICIPDTCISRSHAKIEYNESSKEYCVMDLGSQNGTYVNKIRLSEPKVQSEAKTVFHGNTLAFGSCVLVVHIHAGHNTCSECEPGLLIGTASGRTTPEVSSTPITIMTKADREKERKKQMKMLKKRYGLESADYETPAGAMLDRNSYQDRAHRRRKTVGSSNPYEKDAEPATLDKPIEINNKGYKMLEKLGWSKGQGLGQSSSAILEPINPSVQFDRGGLGMRPTASKNEIQIE